MKFKETEPTLYVYAPNRTTLYGCTPLPSKLSINYRFNTFSEMSFEIRKYYYNERKEEWVKNPLYDKIEKNNLIKIPNDNPVFKYSVNEVAINVLDNSSSNRSYCPPKFISFIYTPKLRVGGF